MNRRLLAAASAGILFSVSMAAFAETGAKVVKEETVYVILSPEGGVRKQIVSDWLHSTAAGSLIRDRSSLTGITNVGSAEEPTIDGNSVSWKPAGRDVYYQGSSTKEAPIGIRISYYLDGKRMSAADMAGKSGKVRIVIEAENRDAHTVSINGSPREVKTPFAAAVLLSLPTETFSGVEVSANGKTLSDGQSQMLLGILLPGLGQSLSANPEMATALEQVGMSSLVLPDSLTITANASSFRLGSVFIVATSDISGLLSGPSGGKGADLDLGSLKDTLSVFASNGDKLEKGVGALAAGSGKLRDGINQLYDSIAPKLAGADEGLIKTALGFIQDDSQVEGARRLIADAKYLAGLDLESVASLSESIDPKALAALERTLADAKGLDLSSISSLPFADLALSEENMAKLKDAIASSEAFAAGMKQADLERASGLLSAAEPFGTDEALAAAVSRLDDATRRDALLARLAKSGLPADDQAALASLVCAAPEIAAAQAGLGSVNAAFLERLLEAVSAQKKLTEQDKGALDTAAFVLKFAASNGGVKKTLKKVETLQGDLTALAPLLEKVGQMAAKGGSAADIDVKALAAKLPGMARDLAASKALLNVAEQALSADNVASLRQVAAHAGELKSGIEALHSGANALADGMATLSEQTSMFNQKGIQMLSKKLEGVAGIIGNASDVCKELIGLSSSYRSFSGIGDGMEGHVKFVMRTEEIQ